MRRLLSTILIFVVLPLQAQVYTDDPAVEPILNEFRNEARKRGVFIDGKIAKHLGAIVTVDDGKMERFRTQNRLPYAILSRKVNRGTYGYVFIEPVVYIRKEVYSSPAGLKAIIFHELGHFLGLDHGTGLMTYEIDLYKSYSKEEWDRLLDQLFDEIKRLPENSHWTKTDNTYH